MCFGHKLSFFHLLKKGIFIKKKKSLNKVSKHKIPHDTFLRLGALRVSKNAIKFEHAVEKYYTLCGH